MNQLADLLKADFYFASRYDGCHWLAGRRTGHLPTLGHDLICDVEPFMKTVDRYVPLLLSDTRWTLRQRAPGASTLPMPAFGSAHHHANQRAGEFDFVSERTNPRLASSSAATPSRIRTSAITSRQAGRNRLRRVSQ
jgi:hypothetical protein